MNENWKVRHLYSKNKLLIAFLVILLVSCNRIGTPDSGINSTVLEPTRVITIATQTLSQTYPFTPASKKTTQTPTLTPSQTSQPRISRLFSLLLPGEYLLLDDGALSLSTKTITSLPVDDIPGGRLSPDGRKTVAINNDQKQPYVFYYVVTDIVTSDQGNIPIVDNCVGIYPSWSPTGSMIMTSCLNHQIIVQSYPEGKEVNRISFDNPDNLDDYDIGPSLWSLDGEWIAYIVYDHGMDPTGRDKVFIVNSECLYHSSVCQETRKSVAELQPSGINLIDWASQDRLVILEQEKHRFIIYDVNNNKVIRMIALPSRFDVRKFAVSPDGNTIFFGQLTADEKGSAIYQALLDDGKIDQLYYGKGLREYLVYYLVER